MLSFSCGCCLIIIISARIQFLGSYSASYVDFSEESKSTFCFNCVLALAAGPAVGLQRSRS